MKKKNKPYFHELGQNEIDALIAEKRTVGYVIENYDQPDWCKYPKALSMVYGCFSLCDLSKDGFRTKISKDFCKDCDCFNDNNETMKYEQSKFPETSFKKYNAFVMNKEEDVEYSIKINE